MHVHSPQIDDLKEELSQAKSQKSTVPPVAVQTVREAKQEARGVEKEGDTDKEVGKKQKPLDTLTVESSPEHKSTKRYECMYIHA